MDLCHRNATEYIASSIILNEYKCLAPRWTRLHLHGDFSASKCDWQLLGSLIDNAHMMQLSAYAALLSSLMFANALQYFREEMRILNLPTAFLGNMGINPSLF